MNKIETTPSDNICMLLWNAEIDALEFSVICPVVRVSESCPEGTLSSLAQPVLTVHNGLLLSCRLSFLSEEWKILLPGVEFMIKIPGPY